MKIVWVASGVLQLAILGLILFFRHYRTLPTFSWYVTLNLLQAVSLLFVYSHYGFASREAFRTYWAAEVIIMVVQTLASTELIHRALQDYPGIWELTWRIILAAIMVVIVIAWATANSNDAWGLLAAHRGYYLTFAVAFVLCLVLIRRYDISIDPVYKMLVGGFCVYACGSIFADTVLKNQYLQHLKGFADVWNYSELFVFVAVMMVWIVALRHPVKVRAQRPTLIPGAYEVVAPQLNAELRAINDTLKKFFDKEAA